MADGMTAAQAATLYERDFHAWTRTQAEALRATAEGRAVPLDWLNLAEEVESLGRRDLLDVTSRLRTIAEHLVKLQHSPAVQPRDGWAATISRARAEIEDLLEQSPSLRRKALASIPAASERGARTAVVAMRERGEQDAARLAEAAPAYTAEHILGDWWPDRRDLR